MGTHTANFSIKTEQGKFEAGTVGGDWQWTLVALGAGIGAPETSWTTADSNSYQEVDEGEYKIAAQRLDADGNPLGPVSSTGFIVEGDTPPTEVYIDVAGSIQVSVHANEVGIG